MHSSIQKVNRSTTTTKTNRSTTTTKIIAQLLPYQKMDSRAQVHQGDAHTARVWHDWVVANPDKVTEILMNASYLMQSLNDIGQVVQEPVVPATPWAHDVPATPVMGGAEVEPELFKIGKQIIDGFMRSKSARKAFFLELVKGHRTNVPVVKSTMENKLKQRKAGDQVVYGYRQVTDTYELTELAKTILARYYE